MSDSVFVIGAPTPLPLGTSDDEREMEMSSLDSAEAVKLVDGAVGDGIVEAEKRHQLLLLARHHGLDSLRTALRLVAHAKLDANQREVLRVCGVSAEDYFRHKAVMKGTK